MKTNLEKSQVLVQKSLQEVNEIEVLLEKSIEKLTELYKIEDLFLFKYDTADFDFHYKIDKYSISKQSILDYKEETHAYLKDLEENFPKPDELRTFLKNEKFESEMEKMFLNTFYLNLKNMKMHLTNMLHNTKVDLILIKHVILG